MKLNFRNRVLITIFISSFICMVMAIVLSTQIIQQQGENSIIEKSQAILTRLEVARKFVAKQNVLGTLVNEMKLKFPDGNLSKEAKETIIKAVPIYASMEIGRDMQEKDHYEFRVFSDEPRRETNRATALEMEIFRKFESNAQLTEFVAKEDALDVIKVYRPVRLSNSENCNACHGDPATSPFANGKDIIGHPMENWPDGKLHGVFAITSSLAPVRTAMASTAWKIIGYGALFTLIGLFIGFLAVRKPISSLNVISGELESSSGEISNISHNTSNASEVLSSASTEAAASLEETVASIEELGSMVKQNSENAQKADDLSKKSQLVAEKGREEINTLIESMTEIDRSSKKIEEIINVIDDIAFQTNLLALNAAVEAARAGEQGKGFAVVAEAVRNLAQRTAVAAKDITQLIKDSVQKTVKGTQVAGQSGTILNEIVDQAQKVSKLIAEIAGASREQSIGLAQISKAMNQLDAATQGNASSAEQVANSSKQMHDQSMELLRLVSELSLQINGQAGLSHSPSKKSKSTSMRSEESSLSHNLDEDSNLSPLHRTSKGGGSRSGTSREISKDLSPERAIPFDDDFGKVGTTDDF